MTKGREKSDARIVPKGRRKAVPTAATRGGRASTASEQAGQLGLFSETADSPKGTDGGADRGQPLPAKHAVPKSENTRGKAPPATMTIRLGVKPGTAWRSIYRDRQSRWALSHNPAVERGLRNAYFAERGLVSLVGRWRDLLARVVVAPVQLMLELGELRVATPALDYRD